MDGEGLLEEICGLAEDENLAWTLFLSVPRSVAKMQKSDSGNNDR